MILCMPSVHRNPVKNFRPPAELYERAKAAVASLGLDMNGYLVDCLRRITGDLKHQGMTAEWAVQADSGGQQRLATDWEPDRGAAVERLEWFRDNAAPSVSYQLIRKTTTVVIEAEPPAEQTL